MDKDLEHYLIKNTIPEPPKAGPSIKGHDDISNFLLSLFKEARIVHPGYKEVKNLIHNEIGIDKESIMEVFMGIGQEEIRKIMDEERNFIKSNIRSVVKEIIKEEMTSVIKHENFPKVIGHTWHYYQDNGQDFKNFILDIMKKEIMDQLSDSFDINLAFNPKEKPKPKVSDETIGSITVTVKTAKGNIYVVDDESLINLRIMQDRVNEGVYDSDKLHIITNSTHHLIDKDELDELLDLASEKWRKEKALWVEAERARLGFAPRKPTPSGPRIQK